MNDKTLRYIEANYLFMSDSDMAHELRCLVEDVRVIRKAHVLTRPVPYRNPERPVIPSGHRPGREWHPEDAELHEYFPRNGGRI